MSKNLFLKDLLETWNIIPTNMWLQHQRKINIDKLDIVHLSTTANLSILTFLMMVLHWVKSVHFWSYSGPQFLAFGLNAERYRVFLLSPSAGKCRPE